MIPLELYKRAAVLASRILMHQWQIIPASLLLWIAVQAVATVAVPLGAVGGFVIGLSQIAALSVFYLWLLDASPRRTSFKKLFVFDYLTFSTILNAAFFIWLIGTAVKVLTSGASELAWLQLAVQGLLLVALNALPEMAYVAKVDGMHVLQETFEFMQRHWIEWLLPMVLLFGPLLALGSGVAVSVLLRTQILLPVAPVFDSLLVFALGGLLTTGLGVVASVWFMLFRKELFELLIARKQLR